MCISVVGVLCGNHTGFSWENPVSKRNHLESIKSSSQPERQTELVSAVLPLLSNAISQACRRRAGWEILPFVQQRW